MTSKDVKTWPNEGVHNTVINEFGTAHSVNIGLPMPAAGTVKFTQVTTNNTVKTGSNADNVNNSMGVGTGNMNDNGLVMTGMCQRILSVHIDNFETEPTATRPSKLRLGTDDFAKGLAKCSLNGVDMDEVILRNVSSIKSLCVSPKKPLFKSSKTSKKKISKIAFPHWLIKWQAISKEHPPLIKIKKLL